MTNIVYKTAGEVAEASSVAAGDDFLLSVGGQTRRVPRDTIRNFAGIFADIATMAASEALSDGQDYSVTTAANGQPDTFTYDAASTATADGALIVTATGMGVGRLVAKRTVYATVAEMLADNRTFADGVNLMAGGYPYITVSADEHLTLAGGQLVQHVAVNNTYHMLALDPNADGATDDSALIDHLNQTGYILDLGGKDYEYSGTFTALARPINGRIIDDNTTRNYYPNTPESQFIATQGRWRANYYTGTVLQVFGGAHVMQGGFRMFGNYYKMGRVVKTGVNGFTTISAADAGDLGAETTRALENWYAQFSCSNDGDEYCDFKHMPYLRVQAVAGSVITLGQAGERKHPPLSTRTYAWADDALAGVECLVINHNAQFNGRVTTITANTAGTVTLADATGLVEGDFLLPAPPGYTEYAWLCDHYMDTAEWRNIADSGVTVGALMVNHATFPASLEVDPAEEFSMAGYISPLATAVIGKLNLTLSTTGVGTLSNYFWSDLSNHEIWSSYDLKTPTEWTNQVFTDSAGDTVTIPRPTSGNFGYQWSKVMLEFTKKQTITYRTDGTLDNTTVSRSWQIRGWLVP